MQWKEFISNPWVGLVGIATLIWGIPGLLDDASTWAQWVAMSPAWSGVAVGVGGTLLGLFLTVKIDQLQRDENTYLHRWVSDIKGRLSSDSLKERWWRFRELSFLWLFLKLALFFGFIVPPLFLILATIVLGGLAFWGWILEGGERTYFEILQEIGEHFRERGRK